MTFPKSRASRIWRFGIVLAFVAIVAAPAGVVAGVARAPISLSIRDTSLAEIYEMLSRQGRVNILLGKGVTGKVSVNLYKVSLDQAIHAVADAAGLVVEQRAGSYFIVPREEAGKDSTAGNTRIRTFKIQYTDPTVAAGLLKTHLSRFGKITTLTKRKLLVVEDLPEFLTRIDQMLRQIDRQPRQILIEAKILEIALNADETYGIDWNLPFRLEGGPGKIGQAGLAPLGLSGFFAQLVTPKFDVFINALRNQGRVRTLSTPKLLVMENDEAQVVIGDRVGFKVTTTINQVTTETVQFIESGVILKVKAAVDNQGRILLDIHPEVSSTTLNAGIPSVKTTEVTTQMLARDGQKIFIGGLIKHNDSEDRSAVPVLSKLPIIGGLFAHNETRSGSTETVVLITPHLIDMSRPVASRAVAAEVAQAEQGLRLKGTAILHGLPSVVDAAAMEKLRDSKAGPSQAETEVQAPLEEDRH